MAGSLVAARDAIRKAARDAAADPAVPAGATGTPDVKDAEATGTGPASLLTVSGLSVSYGRIRALNDISLSVRSGELVALAGENGAGKTSLVRCIAGTVVPASGEIYLGGRRIPADPAGAAKLVVDLVRARRGAQQRAAVHSPGQ